VVLLSHQTLRRYWPIEKTHSSPRRVYNDHARETGWPNTAAVYEAQKRFNDLDLDASDTIQELLKERIRGKTLRRDKR